jgi:epsilon-lactone hydrolase
MMGDRTPSLQARIVKTVLKLQPHSWARGSIPEQRSRQEKSATRIRGSKAIRFDPIKINTHPAAWISESDQTRGVVLYLHGGAYALGSVSNHREFLGRLAWMTGAKVLAIDYRLAPENPFPAALNDAVGAYQWLLTTGILPSQIVIAGDSAGGGLSLAAITALRDAGDPLPACAVCFSPWVDLTLSCESIETNAKADPILSRAVLTPYAEFYAGDRDMRNPLISPLFANLRSFPPLLIHVGEDEILLDEAVQLANSARSAGVDVGLKIWPGMFHVFQIVPFLPEANDSLSQVAEFIRRHLLLNKV